MIATPLLAFHGDPAIKDKYIARVRAHAEADEIVKGSYWEHGKGCAVGCTIHSSHHSVYETELGVPRIIARLEDCIFEGLPNGEAKKFPLRFLDSIAVGADLSNVFPRMMIYILRDCRPHAAPDGVAAIDRCVRLFERRLAGKRVSQGDWSAVADAAAADADAAAAADAARWYTATDAARWYAATDARWYSAADAARWYAATAATAARWCAADATADATPATATAAAAAAAAAAADDAAASGKAYKRYAAELLRLLKQCQPADNCQRKG